ncbi:MAG: hypothetical protein GF347_00560, partial [Candidatus Moranbacteria bacterium]|nr:hypothetical protein [Candidatus Moranbacteria bacterium]
MKIGIDASRAYEKNPTGVGRYAKELIESLIEKNHLIKEHEIILFLKPEAKIKNLSKKLPLNWKIKQVFFKPFLWSQIGLTLAFWR